jgi:hypothetical protein
VLSPLFLTILFWIAATLAFVGQSVVLLDAFRGKTPAADVTRSGRARELTWIVLPAIVLAVVLWASWSRLRERVADGEVVHTTMSPGGTHV